VPHQQPSLKSAFAPIYRHKLGTMFNSHGTHSHSLRHSLHTRFHSGMTYFNWKYHSPILTLIYYTHSRWPSAWSDGRWSDHRRSRWHGGNAWRFCDNRSVSHRKLKRALNAPSGLARFTRPHEKVTDNEGIKGPEILNWQLVNARALVRSQPCYWLDNRVFYYQSKSELTIDLWLWSMAWDCFTYM